MFAAGLNSGMCCQCCGCWLEESTDADETNISGNQWLVAGVAVLLSAFCSPGIAQSRSISESAQLISTPCFTVIDADIEDHLFEFEAIKNNQKWTFKKRS